MAKLSAKGRTELFKASKTLLSPEFHRYVTRAFMSDGTVLRKSRTVYLDGREGHRPWRVEGKFKPDTDMENVKLGLMAGGWFITS